jgi:hypothetical protein
MLLQYLYTITKLLCFDIEFRVLRYRCFFVGSSLGCQLGTGHRLRCAHCIANQSSPVAHAPPGPPSAAAAEAALGGAAAPAAPGAAPAAAPAAAARAGINGTQERVILGDKNEIINGTQERVIDWHRLLPPERRPQPPEWASTECRSV